MQNPSRPEVVVLGSGFAGLWAALTLSKGQVNVTLVDQHNYHTFFPLLYQVGAAELDSGDITQPLRRIFWKHPNVYFQLAVVQKIDLSSKVVRTDQRDIPYDYLVIALGSKSNFFGIPGAEEYGFTLKSLEQGITLRNHILTCFERASCEDNPDIRRSWLTFTIVGGGPTGVEFAGALSELVRGSLRADYPTLDLKQVKIILLEALDHLLTGMPAELSDYTQKRLEKMGVEVRLKSQVVKLTPQDVLLKDGVQIPSRTMIWTAGVSANLPGDQSALPTNRKMQAEVLPTLQVPDHSEVYVVGDASGIQQDGKPLPMVAQVGIQSGTTAGKNILRQVSGQAPLPFHYRDKGNLAVIGRNAAAAYIWNRPFKGFLAWLIWLVVHIFFLIGFRNRLMVLINWAWAYLFGEHGVRIIAPSPAPYNESPQVVETNSASEFIDSQ